MEEYIGRELTVEEATFGHNEGKKSLKKVIESNGNPESRVSGRSKEYQEDISNAINSQ